MNVLVTGSSGLIGSESVRFFADLGFPVLGIDNNMRADFFGPAGDTTATRLWLEAHCPSFTHRDLDIRQRADVDRLFRSHPVDLVVHCAAQPSHDLAATRPYDDFDVNAGGTLNLLDACRRHAPDAVFIHVSTNKVYGDGPNRIALRELETRWDYADPRFAEGIAEDFPVDHCLHSVFGASKLAGDIMAQEYGRYFGLRTGIFRGGCLTGPQHAGVELHGFLNYLVRVALREGPYTVFGYKGKQVRDQIHAQDVVRAFWCFAQDPRPGEVYNLGGGRENAASLVECVEAIARKTGKRPRLTYTEANRVGDHICYYSDLRKLRAHYPTWQMAYSLDSIIDQLIETVVGTDGS
jgi:CDP-paratose 2-epimerase